MNNLNSGRGRKQVRKKSGWASPDLPTNGLHSIPFILSGGLTMEQQEALVLRCRLEEINRKLNQREYNMTDDRSPSPEPIYDDRGKRINTREQRAKDKIQDDLNKLVEMAFLMDSNFKPPLNYDPKAVRKMRKIFIPVEKHPGYNFFGLILGPRGGTQKEMEKATGCKISIRGRGSVRDGKVKKFSPGDNEDPHVLIIGPTDSQVNKAANMVKELLVPLDDDVNMHKRKQLYQLAVLQGTLVSRSWEPTDLSYRRTDISCDICRDMSHPTIDCPLRGDRTGASKGLLEQEYETFLLSIGEKSASSSFAASSVSDAYAAFKAELTENLTSH
eukprot:TRINITY_DN12567_c0_g1_i1.p1 TRINITY_DN12567_c0_g1~~TRINITY_DN12567_c0_g1_i1.p1  ORF type:complete len:330 (-),score=72.47 TRINITY_DN12567_c0_g1_i1:117-1106(-)